MSRSKTTSIPRPSTPPAAADAGRSRLGDLTGHIPHERRMLRGRWMLIAGLFGVAVLTAITAAVFILPIQTWFDQDDTLVRRQAELDELQRVNGQLAGEVERLQTDDGIREAAREEIGFVEQGDQRRTILPLPALPSDLPDGWPYNVVTRILDARARPAE